MDSPAGCFWTASQQHLLHPEHFRADQAGAAAPHRSPAKLLRVLHGKGVKVHPGAVVTDARSYVMCCISGPVIRSPTHADYTPSSRTWTAMCTPSACWSLWTNGSAKLRLEFTDWSATNVLFYWKYLVKSDTWSWILLSKCFVLKLKWWEDKVFSFVVFIVILNHLRHFPSCYM